MNISNDIIVPDINGFYGEFGGAFVPEILRPVLQQLEQNFREISNDQDFWDSFITELTQYSCRPTPITPLHNLSAQLGGAKIYLKREDLNQTGAHKLNNVVGQALLAKRMNKTRLIAETGAGQHGVATAMIAARFGLDCTIYMGAEDVQRQHPNVFWMRRMGAEVITVEEGTQTLKDAINAALRDWIESFEDTHYLLGTAAGPHPFPALVMWFQSVIGKECAVQMRQLLGRDPDRVYACVGGGSNALGIFQGFLHNPQVLLIGAEAGGQGTDTQSHAARLATSAGKIGVAHGYKSYFLSNTDGQMNDTYSIAAGLDYIGISPVLSHLHTRDRVQFTTATDDETTAATELLMNTEGIIPALESAHGLAAAIADAPSLSPENTLLVNLSGRGDKDIFNMANIFDPREWRAFLAEQIGSEDAD